MKVGIVTNYGNNNYGTTLQNYATEQILKTLGLEVETIIKSKKNLKPLKDVLYKFNKMNFSRKCYEIYRKVSKKAQCYKYKNELIKRKDKIKQFIKMYLHEEEYIINKEMSKKFDYFIVGSDCIWSIDFDSSFKFLRFAPKNKRIAFAPSFGQSTIPKLYKEIYKKCLKEFAQLSVREQTGVEIIKELTGLNAEILLDPTMLLSKEHWVFLSKKSVNKDSEKYLLTYILGNKLYKWTEQIDTVAKKYNLKVINLNDIHDKKRYVEGPSEFIDYFRSAEIIFTDSFHGTIFAILFNKPFIVYKKSLWHESSFSRIDNLLKKFNFESRFGESINNKEILNIDFSHVQTILEAERKKAYDYLNKALR